MRLIIPMGDKKGETGKIIKSIDLVESRLRIQLKSFFPKLYQEDIIDIGFTDNITYIINLDNFPNEECQRLIQETLKDYKLHFEVEK